MRFWFSTLLDFIFPPRNDEQLVRAAPPSALLPLMHPEDSGIAVSLLPFRHPLVRAAVHEAKYHDNRKAQRLLAEVLAAHLASIKEKFVIIPIPLSRERMKSRGFNQCERLATLAGAPVNTRLLFRTRDTGQQTRLSRAERMKNMEHAFAAHAADPNTLYLILDDVVTTGSTIQAAADALRHAGATRVMPIAVAG